MSDKPIPSKEQPIKLGAEMVVDAQLLADFKSQANRNDWVEQDYVAHESYHQEAIDRISLGVSHLAHLAACSDSTLTSALNAANNLKSLIEAEIARRA